MSELLRAFAKRSPQPLTQNSITSYGIETHPENHQSERFMRWHSLCKTNSVSALKEDMTEFLQGGDSIKQIDDLGPIWSQIIRKFFSIGQEIKYDNALKIIEESSGSSSRRDGALLFRDPVSAIADTTLSLAYLKNLGHRENIDYQSAIKVMAFVESTFTADRRVTVSNVRRYFERPVLLPWCFFYTDPCGEAISLDIPFPFMDPALTKTRKEEDAKGCTSDNCKCHLNEECLKQSNCCAKPRIDLIDLLIVKESTKGYVAGDLSYIKNVLEGENLSTRHRRLERTEELIETQEDIRQFEERYLQTEEKASLQQETENVLRQDRAFDAGLTTNSHFGVKIGGMYDIGGGTNTTTNISSKDSKTFTNKQVRDYSKDTIDRATKQVEAKVRKLVSTKRLFETEEKNRHTFDNTAGKNINGQYLYVNKLSRAQVYNYGRKAVLDLVLPEPAALYKRLFENKFPGIEPLEPHLPAIDPTTITPENYESLIAQFGLKDVPAPPAFITTVVVTLEDTPGDPKGDKNKSGSHTYVHRCTIPAKYVGNSMSVVNIRLNYNKDGGVSISATLGPNGDMVFHQINGANNLGIAIPLPSIEGSNEIIVHTWDVTEYTWIMTVHCELKDEFKDQWRNEVFAKIDEVRQKALDEYEKALAEYKKEKEEFDAKEEALRKERYNKNPFINRETEKAELKRMAISYISCQFFDQFDAMKHKVEPCGYPEMFLKEAEEEGKFVQFFEQAFNWNLITYIFYPYFWGKKCSWGDKIKEEAGDLIFEKFLQAGSCRVLIPIRDGFFDYMTYFLLTGEIWGGTGTTPLPNDPHYISLAQEIKEQKENFNTEREGTVDVTKGKNTVVLNNTDHYWDIISNSLNVMNINADIDREIFLDFQVYRIVGIQPNPAVTTPDSWIITIDRNYEGVTQTNMKWSTGAVFVGAPWDFITPTTLTFLREKSVCLPSYPLEECVEV
jgi:hypothetical protein